MDFPCAAFVGALCDGGGHLRYISPNAGVSRLTVVFSGIAITIGVRRKHEHHLIVASDAYVGSSMFLAGGFSRALLRDLASAALIAVGLAAGFSGAHRLNIIALGDDMAYALGLYMRASRLGMLSPWPRFARRRGGEFRRSARLRRLISLTSCAFGRSRQPRTVLLISVARRGVCGGCAS